MRFDIGGRSAESPNVPKVFARSRSQPRYLDRAWKREKEIARLIVAPLISWSVQRAALMHSIVPYVPTRPGKTEQSFAEVWTSAEDSRASRDEADSLGIQSYYLLAAEGRPSDKVFICASRDGDCHWSQFRARARANL